MKRSAQGEELPEGVYSFSGVKRSRPSSSTPLQFYSPIPSSLESKFAKTPESIKPSFGSSVAKGYVSSNGIVCVQQGRHVYLWSISDSKAIVTKLEVPVTFRNGVIMPSLVAVFSLPDESASTDPIATNNATNFVSVVAVTAEGHIRYWYCIDLKKPQEKPNFNDFNLRKKEVLSVKLKDHELYTRIFVDEEEHSLYISSEDANSIVKLSANSSKKAIELTIIYVSNGEYGNSSTLGSLLSWTGLSHAGVQEKREHCRSLFVIKDKELSSRTVVLTDRYLRMFGRNCRIKWEWSARDEIANKLAEELDGEQKVWLLDITSNQRTDSFYILTASTPRKTPPNTIPLVSYHIWYIKYYSNGPFIEDHIPLKYQHDYEPLQRDKFIYNTRIYFTGGPIPTLFVLFRDNLSWLVHIDDMLESDSIIAIPDNDRIIGSGVLKKNNTLCIITSKRGIFFARIEQRIEQRENESQRHLFQLKPVQSTEYDSVEPFIELVKKYVQGTQNENFFLTLRVNVSPQIIVDASKAIIDAKILFSQWAGRKSSTSKPSSLILEQLEVKKKRHNLLLKILTFSSHSQTGERLLSMLKEERLDEILKNSEALEISIRLRKSSMPQNTNGNNNDNSGVNVMDTIVDLAIKNCCANRGFSDYLCTPEQFYSCVSHVSELFKELINLESQYHEKGNLDKMDIVKTNDAFKAMISGVMDHRDTLENYFHISSNWGDYLSKIYCPLIYKQIQITAGYAEHLETLDHILFINDMYNLSNFYTFALRNLTRSVPSYPTDSIRLASLINIFKDKATSLSKDAAKLAKEKAFSLAEEYHAFENLIDLCQKFLDDSERNEKFERYLSKYQDTDFPNILFEYYLKEKQYFRLLSNSNKWNDKFKYQIGKIIRGNPELEWMYAVQYGSMRSALPHLSEVLEREKDIKAKKQKASLLKLVALCARKEGNDDNSHLKKADDYLFLMECQKFLKKRCKLYLDENLLSGEAIIKAIYNSTLSLDLPKDKDTFLNIILVGFDIYNKFSSGFSDPEILTDLWCAAWNSSSDLLSLIPNIDIIPENELKDKIESSILYHAMTESKGSPSELTISVFNKLEKRIEETSTKPENAKRLLLEVYSLYNPL